MSGSFGLFPFYEYAGVSGVASSLSPVSPPRVTCEHTRMKNDLFPHFRALPCGSQRLLGFLFLEAGVAVAVDP